MGSEMCIRDRSYTSAWPRHHRREGSHSSGSYRNNGAHHEESPHPPSSRPIENNVCYSITEGLQPSIALRVSSNLLTTQHHDRHRLHPHSLIPPPLRPAVVTNHHHNIARHPHATEVQRSMPPSRNVARQHRHLVTTQLKPNHQLVTSFNDTRRRLHPSRQHLDVDVFWYC